MDSKQLKRLVVIATVLSLVAAFTVAYVVIDLGGDAAYDSAVMQPMLGFGAACFALSWPAVFVVGWLLLRNRGTGAR